MFCGSGSLIDRRYIANVNVDCTMLNKEQNPEECDATGFDSSNADRYKKLIARKPITQRVVH